jgi:dihydrodipicolinate synthase/N-acetylneuraminate lyase
MFTLEEILSGLVTPFMDNGKDADGNGLRALGSRCIKLGVHGIISCSTTGE